MMLPIWLTNVGYHRAPWSGGWSETQQQGIVRMSEPYTTLDNSYWSWR